MVPAYPGCPGKNAVKRCSSSTSLHVFDIPVSGDFVGFTKIFGVKCGSVGDDGGTLSVTIACPWWHVYSLTRKGEPANAADRQLIQQSIN